MELSSYLDSIRSEGRDLAAAASRAGLAARVPACPDWDVAGLVDHMGRVHRWAEGMVRSQASERGDFPPASAAEDLLAWYENGVELLAGTLATADTAASVWTFWPPHGAAFWFRRMAQETSVHRWDAESAVDDAHAIDADLAIDGIDEFLDGFLPRMLTRRPDADLGGSVHLHATDRPGEWLVRITSGTADVRKAHDKGDVAIRGSASDLLLWLWGRVDVNRLERFGDVALTDQWRTVAAAP